MCRKDTPHRISHFFCQVPIPRVIMPHPAQVAARLPRPCRRPRISSRSLLPSGPDIPVIPRGRTNAPASAFAASFFRGRARCIAPATTLFLGTWYFSFSRYEPCRPIAFRRLRPKRHASRSPSLCGRYPLHRYYGSIRPLPPCLRRDRSPKFPCRTFGTRHVPMPRPAGRTAKRIRRVRVGFRYHDPLGHGRPFGWKYRGVHTGLHFRLAHSFVGLGFCASVALRAASLPIGMSFPLPYRFLSLC